MDNPNSYIPNDIVEAILLKLPARSLLRFKTVSNNFLSLISSPRFISARPSSMIFQTCPSLYYLWSIPSTGHSPVLQVLEPPAFYDRERLTLVGCDNGIVCIKAIFESDYSTTTTFTLWNPATRQFRHMIPCPRFRPTTIVGFGYQVGVEDYKLFAIIEEKLQVLQLRRGTWREIDTYIGLRGIIYSHYFCSAVVVAGIWYRVHATNCGPKMLSFDFKEDSFALIDPPFSRGEFEFGVVLGVRDQKLCSFAMSIDCWCRGWMMVEEASWTEMLTIDLCSVTIERPIVHHLRLWSTWQGTRLLLTSDESYYFVDIIPGALSHDSLTPRCEEIPKFDRCLLFHEAYDFVESLVSPFLR